MIRGAVERVTFVMASARTAATAAGRRRLVAANLSLVGLLLVHALDHALRQDASVPAAAQALGGLGIVTALGSLGLAVGASRLAPLSTAVVGLSTAGGSVGVHLLPHWGPFSQPYQDLGVDTVSWIGMLLPIIGAVIVAGVGSRAVRDLRRAGTRERLADDATSRGSPGSESAVTSLIPVVETVGIEPTSAAE